MISNSGKGFLRGKRSDWIFFPFRITERRFVSGEGRLRRSSLSVFDRIRSRGGRSGEEKNLFFLASGALGGIAGHIFSRLCGEGDFDIKKRP